MTTHDLRVIYRGLRYAVGLIGTTLASSVLLVQSLIGQPGAGLFVTTVLGALTLVMSLTLAIRSITPMWLLHPNSRRTCALILGWVAGIVGTLAAELSIVLPGLGAEALLVPLWSALGLLFVLTAGLVPMLAWRNAVAGRTYGYVYIPRRPLTGPVAIF